MRAARRRHKCNADATEVRAMHARLKCARVCVCVHVCFGNLIRLALGASTSPDPPNPHTISLAQSASTVADTSLKTASNDSEYTAALLVFSRLTLPEWCMRFVFVRANLFSPFSTTMPKRQRRDYDIQLVIAHAKQHNTRAA